MGIIRGQNLRVLKSSVANLLAFSKCGFWSNLIKFIVTSMREQNLSNLPSIRTQSKSAPKLAKSSEALEFLRII